MQTFSNGKRRFYYFLCDTQKKSRGKNAYDHSTTQEIIKVREWIPHIHAGPPTKVIPLKLFLDIVPSSSAEITRALGGCFREGFVYMYFVSFHFKAKENLQRCWNVFFDILITTTGASALGMFWDTFRNFNRSLNKRRMPTALTITTEWTAEKCWDKRQTNPQTQARQPNKQMVKTAGRGSPPKLQKAATATMSIKRRVNIQRTNLARI